MSVLPIVSPANNADGIALQPVITALYPFPLDEGSVTVANCFLVKKVSTISSNQTVPVPIKVSLKRIQLTSSLEFTGVDYGTSGDLYRSLIEITPVSQLESHSEYSVILSKDLGKSSVFDVEPLTGNTGTKLPLARGPFSGLSNKTYKLTVTSGGSESTAVYSLQALPSGPVIGNLVAKKRFIEIENGLFLKFETGTYVAGDDFTIACKPLIKTNEIYSWDFKTGDSLYTVPADVNSGVIIDLPVNNNTGGPINPNAPFKLVSVTPSLNSVMNNPANKTVTFEFSKNINPTSVTTETIKIIAESTATLYYGAINFTHQVTDNKLIITFE
jgi:hypothetical protein